MFALVISEWREWRDRGMPWSILSGVFLMAAIAGLSSLLPLAVLWAFSLWSLLFGWSRGKRGKGGAGFADRSARAELGAVLAGRIVSGTIAYLMGAAALCPVLVAMAMVWGPPAGVLAQAALQWYPLFLLGLGASISTGEVKLGEEGFLGALLIVVWFMATLVLKPLSFMNPFALVWRLLAGTPGPGAFLCAASNLALAAAFIALASGVMAKLRRSRGA
jgi:hypothetical protein